MGLSRAESHPLYTYIKAAAQRSQDSARGSVLVMASFVFCGHGARSRYVYIPHSTFLLWMAAASQLHTEWQSMEGERATRKEQPYIFQQLPDQAGF